MYKRFKFKLYFIELIWKEETSFIIKGKKTFIHLFILKWIFKWDPKKLFNKFWNVLQCDQYFDLKIFALERQNFSWCQMIPITTECDFCQYNWTKLINLDGS